MSDYGHLQLLFANALQNPDMVKILWGFGHTAFRRSSAIDGLEQFIQRCGIGGGTCVEIGTWNGVSAVVLSRYFDKVISLEIIPRQVKHEILHYLGIKNVRFVDISGNDQKKDILEEAAFDFAYMDGNHHADTELDWSLVRKCGRVLFHEAWEKQPKVLDILNSLPGNQVTRQGHWAYWNERGPYQKPDR